MLFAQSNGGVANLQQLERDEPGRSTHKREGVGATVAPSAVHLRQHSACRSCCTFRPRVAGEVMEGVRELIRLYPFCIAARI